MPERASRRSGTRMGASVDCNHQHTDPRNLHTKGMIGGGWRVEGVGGGDHCTLTIYPEPPGGVPTTIVVDRNGHVAEVSRP